jgi:hypothetical protein
LTVSIRRLTLWSWGKQWPLDSEFVECKFCDCREYSRTHFWRVSCWCCDSLDSPTFAKPCYADSPDSPTFAKPCYADSPDSTTFAEPCCADLPDSPDSPTLTEPCCPDSPDLPTRALVSFWEICDSPRHIRCRVAIAYHEVKIPNNDLIRRLTLWSWDWNS